MVDLLGRTADLVAVPSVSLDEGPLADRIEAELRAVDGLDVQRVGDNGLGHLFRDRPELVAGDVAILGEPTGGAIEAGCQGSMRMAITLVGQRAHTARPWMGRNAIHRAGRVLSILDAYEPRHPVLDGCEFREALQAVAIEGGVAGNVVPDRAVVHLNHRFAPDRT